MSTILNTPAMRPASLGGNTSLYESRGGTKKRIHKKRTNKRRNKNRSQRKYKSLR